MKYIFILLLSVFLCADTINIDTKILQSQIEILDKQKVLLENLLAMVSTKVYYLDKQKASWDNNNTSFTGLVRTVYEDKQVPTDEAKVTDGSFKIQIQPNMAFHLVFRTTTSTGEMTHKNAYRLSISSKTGKQTWRKQSPVTKRWHNIDIYDNSIKAEMIPFSQMKWL